MPDFNRFRKDLPDVPQNNAEEQTSFSAPITKPKPFDARVRKSRIGNSGFQEAHRDEIRQEYREEEQRHRDMQTARREQARAAEKAQAEAERRQREQAAHAKKVRNAAFEDNARKRGAKIYKDEFGDWKQETDEEGRAIFHEFESDPYQDDSGRFVKKKRDRFGATVIEDADKGAKWEVGENGKLVRKNKYNPIEERDASEYIDDPELGSLAKKSLYKADLQQRKAEIAKETLLLQDPELDTLTDSQREKALAEIKKLESMNGTEYAQPERIAELRKSLSADDEIRQRKDALHDKKVSSFDLEQGGIEAWEARRKAEEEKKLAEMPADKFKAYTDEKKASLKSRVQEFQSYQKDTAQYLQKQSEAIEQEAQEIANIKAQGVRADEIQALNEREQELNDRRASLSAEFEKYSSHLTNQSTSLQREQDRINKQIEFKNADLAGKERIKRSERVQDIKDTAKSIDYADRDTVFRRSLSAEEEQLRDQFNELAEAVDFGDETYLLEKIAQVGEAREKLQEKDNQRSNRNSIIYNILLEGGVSDTSLEAIIDPYRTKDGGEIVRDAARGTATFMASLGGKSIEAENLPKDVQMQVRNLLPGNPNDAEVKAAIADAVRENKFDATANDYAHLLEDGRVAFKSEAIFADEKIRAAIEESGATGFRKNEALRRLEAAQENLANQYHLALESESSEYRQFLKDNDFKNQDREALIQFFAENAETDGFWKSMGVALQKGSVDLVGSMSGAVYGVTGADWSGELMTLAQGASENIGVQQIAEGQYSNLATDVAAAAPSLAPTLMSGTLGRGATAFLGKLGMAADKAMKAGAIFGTTSMYLTGGGQSYGGYLQAKYSELESTIGKEAALEKIRTADVQVPAIASGISTALLMKLKPGGAESMVNGTQAGLQSYSLRELAKMAGTKGGLQKALSDKAFRQEIGKMLRDTVWHGAKDEAVEEGLDQLFQGIIDNTLGDGNKSLDELIMESLHAGIVGGILGGTVEGATSNIQKRNPVDTRLTEIRSEIASKVVNSDNVQAIEAANNRIATEGNEPLSQEELQVAGDLLPAYGASLEGNEVLNQVETLEAEAREAEAAGDIDTAREKVSQVSKAAAKLDEIHQAQAVTAINTHRELSAAESDARGRIQQAQESHRQAIMEGDREASRAAVESVEMARMDMAKVYRSKGLAKVSAGKGVDSLTAAELRSIGLVRNFTTNGEDSVQAMTESQLKSVGLTSPAIELIGGQAIVTDEGAAEMKTVAPSSAGFVAMTETAMREKMQAAAKAEAQNAAKENAPAVKASPEKATTVDKSTKATNKASTWTAKGKNGTIVTVEAGSAKEAQEKLALQLGRTSPGEVLNLDSIQQSKGSSSLENPDNSNNPEKPEGSNKSLSVQARKAILKAPVDSRKAYSQTFDKVLPAIEKAASSFSGVKVVSGLKGAGFAMEDGQLLVDPVKLGTSLKGSSDSAIDSWIKAAIVEEVIHNAATQVISQEEAEAIWNSLSASIKKRVQDVYGMASIQSGNKAAGLDAFTGFHEFIRMVIQKDPAVLGYLTEQAGAQVLESTGKTVLETVVELLQDILGFLNNAEQTPEIKDASKRIKEAMGIISTDEQVNGTPEPASSIATKEHKQSHKKDTPKNYNGSRGVSYLPDGSEVNFEWRVVDINDLVISNRDSGAVNPDYPSELQPRDRSSSTSNAQVQDISRNTNYARLSDNPSVGDGAPFVGEDGVVESGNGRMMGLRRAYEQGYENVNSYRADLIADAESKGIDVQSVESLQYPVLVRIRTSENMSRREFVELANVSTVSSMRESERAQTDAERLTRNPETLRNLDVTEDGKIFTSANDDFLQAFVMGVPANERGEMIDAQGRMNATGRRRVTNALIAAAYGKSNDLNTIAQLTESVEDEGKNLNRIMVAMAPSIAEQGQRFEQGTLYPDLDISDDLATAVARIINLRSRGEKVSDYLSQQQFGFDGDESFVNELIGFLEENKMAPKRAIKVLQKYGRMVEHAGSPQDGDMFGESPDRDKMWKVARTNSGKLEAGEIQGDMFEDGSDLPLFTQKQRMDPDMFPTVGLELFDNSQDNPQEQSKTSSRSSGDSSIDEQLRETFGDYEADQYGLPPMPITLEDGDPLLKPTKKKKRVTVPSDNPLVVSGLVEAGEMSRKDFGQAIIQFFLSQGKPLAPGEKKVVYATGGGGGAGKSTILKQLKAQGVINMDGAVEVNADDIKALIPEFDQLKEAGDGRAAAIVHEESSQLAKNLLDALLNPENESFNFIYDATLSNKEGGLKQFARWKAAGYEIHLIGVTIDPLESMKRAVLRGSNSGRWVPSEMLAKAHEGFNGAVAEYMELADRANIYDNTPREAVEVVEKTSPESQINIVNQQYYENIKLYETFSEKIRFERGTGSERSGRQAEVRQVQSEGRRGGSQSSPRVSPEAKTEVSNERSSDSNGTEPVRSEAGESLDGEGADGPSPSSSSGQQRNGRSVSGQSGSNGRLNLGREGDNQGNESAVQAGKQPNTEASESTRSDQRGRSGGSRSNQSRLTPRTQPENQADRNAVIDPSETLSPKGFKAKAQANLEAMRLLKTLESEGRNPTAEEKQTLLAYSGWGALSQAFDVTKGNEVDKYKDTYLWTSTSYSQGFIKPLKQWDKQWGELHRELKSVMSDAEFKAASRSTLNAHYTTPEIIGGIWEVVQKLGFKGGTALEPGAGVGHFIGTQPQGLALRTDWSAVELDHTSARILSKLYPESRVNSVNGGNSNREVSGEGFESSIIPNNSIDVAISNVPFAQVGPHQAQKEHGQKLNLHNYFFARALDKVRPGGIVAFITTSHTMESQVKQRELLATKGELIGALRLPNTAFKENAGTEVTTDVIFLRKPTSDTPSQFAKSWITKREVGSDIVSINPFGDTAPTLAKFHDEILSIDRDWVPVDRDLQKAWEKWNKNRPASGPTFKLVKSLWEAAEDESGKVSFKAPIYVNEYFAEHPENVLGTNSLQGTMYSAGEYSVANSGKDIKAEFKRFVDSLPGDIMGKSETKAKSLKMAERGDQIGDYVVKDGTVYMVDGDELVEAEWTKEKKTRHAHKSWLGLLDITERLLQAEQTSSDESVVEDLRAELNQIYDKHIKLFGPISSKARNNPHKPFSNAPKFVVTEALENVEKVLKDKKFELVYNKADIFSKRLNRPYTVPESADTVSDAVTQSLTWTGGLSVDFMAKQLGRDADSVRDELLESKLAFMNPSTGFLETPESYLTGNVGAKLKAAQEAVKSDPSLQKNVDSLQDALPDRIPVSKITATLGATWIPTEVIGRFAEREMGIRNARIDLVREINQFTVSGNSSGDGKYQTSSHAPTALLDAALNSKTLTVRRRISETETVVDMKATLLANSTVSRIKRDFARWAQNTDEDIEAGPIPDVIEERFNDTSNNLVPPKFKGDHITLPGASDEVYRNSIRKAVIARMLSQGSGMIAHGVGFGKTYTLIALGMELKRLGKANKPMIVVQNSTAKQFAQSIKVAYPGAKVLIANEQTFAKKNRRKLTAQIATGDWDLIMMAQSQFDKIPASEEAVSRYIDEQIEELKTATEQLRSGNGDKNTVKMLEKSQSALEERRKGLLAELKKNQDSSLNFEDLGVDALLVDEAHNYKSVPFVTKKGRIKGITNGKDSQRAIGMVVKSRDIHRKKAGKGIFFATGTPVTNTMVEAYNMMRFVSPETLKESDIFTFDDFANKYGDVVENIESTWKGKIESVTRFAKFVNGKSLIDLIRSSWDVEMDADKAGLKRPNIKGGKAENVITKKTDTMARWSKWVVDTAEKFLKTTKSERAEHNWMNAIPVMTLKAGTAAALDPRMIHPGAKDEPGSKLNEAVKKVADIYKAGTENKSTQVIFTDMAKSFDMSLLSQFNGNPFEGYTDTVRSSFNLMAELKKKLSEAGVKASEIIEVTGSTPQKRRKEIFDKVNSGEYRVVVGSTQTLGVGVNIQERLKAVHNLMPPASFKPADMEQRIGRILRQGNMHYDLGEDIEIINYGVEGSMDSAVYNIMAKKQNFINQVLMGQVESHSFDDPGDEVSVGMEEMAARAMGDPDLIRLVELNAKLKTLELEEQGAVDALQTYRSGLRNANRRLEAKESQQEKAQAMQDTIQPLASISDDKLPVWNIGGVVIDRNPPEDKPKGWKSPGLLGEITTVLSEESDKLKTNDVSRTIPLTIGGVDFRLRLHHSLESGKFAGDISIKGFPEHEASWESPRALTIAVSNLTKDAANAVTRLQDSIESIKNEIQTKQNIINNHSWEGAEEIQSIRDEIDEVKVRLSDKAEAAKDDDKDGGAATPKPPKAPQGPSGSILESAPIEKLMDELDSGLPADLDKYVDQASKEAKGEFTYGRPDLAYGASDPIARGVDEARKQDAEQLTNAKLNAEAKRLISEDEDGILRQLFDAAAEGNSLDNPAIVRAAALLRVKLSKEAIRTGDQDLMRKAQILTWAYRETGTTWAREGFARRDLHKSPADRARDFIMESVSGFDPQVMEKFKKSPVAAAKLKRIDVLQNLLKEAQAKGSEKVEQQVREKLAKENEEYLKLQNKEFDAYRKRVEDSLNKMGITLDDIFGERVTLKLKARNLMKDAKSGFNEKQLQAINLMEKETSIKDIIAKTELSRRQIQDTLDTYRKRLFEQLNSFGEEVYENGGDLFTMEAARDLLESPRLEAGNMSQDEKEARIRMVMKAMGVPETVLEYEKKVKRTRKPKKKKVATIISKEELAEIEERFEQFKDKDLEFYRSELQNLGLDDEQSKILAGEWDKYTHSPNVGKAWIDRFESTTRRQFDINNPADVQAVYRIIEMERPNRWVDVVKELFINNILSAPITQITNLTGMAYAGYEGTLGRAIEASFNLGLRKQGGAEFEEFGIIFRGMRGKIGQAFNLAIQAFNDESSPFEKEFLDAQVEIGFNPMHDTRGFRPVIKGKKGRVIRVPGRMLLATDTFFKSLIAMMEVGAMAYRLGRANGMEKGSQQLEDFIASQTAMPGSVSWRAAAELAEKRTFTNALRDRANGGGFFESAVKKFGQIAPHGGESHSAQAGELLATMFFPFITTPFRLLQLGLSKTVYGAGFNTLRALSKLRIRDGKLQVTGINDAQKITMLADGLFAATAFGVLWGLAEGDDDDDDKWLVISGSADMGQGQRNLQYRTIPPNSIRIGGKDGTILNYGRLDPFSTVIGTTVDTIRAIKRIENGDDQLHAVAQLQHWMVSQVEGKTVMRGMQDLGSLVEGRKSVAEWGAGQVASVLVPNIIRNPMRNTDEVMRDTRTEPFSKEALVYNFLPNPWYAPPARLDLYGNEIKRHDGGVGGFFTQAFSPFRNRDAAMDQPWDDFLARYNRVNPNENWAPGDPSKTYKKHEGDRKATKMTTEEYQKYTKLSAKLMAAELAGLNHLLNKELPTVDDKDEVKKAITRARSNAKELMFPVLPPQPVQ